MLVHNLCVCVSEIETAIITSIICILILIVGWSVFKVQKTEKNKLKDCNSLHSI